MKYLKYLFLLIILFPLTVFAEDTCNNGDIVIKDLELVDINGMATEVNDAEIEGSKIIIDAKMFEVGDSVTYHFVIKNDSNNDYEIDTRNFANNPYIHYEFTSEDHSNRIAKSSSKTFTLTASYDTEVETTSFKAGKYDASIDTILEIKDPALINPITGNFFIYILFLLLVVCIIFGLIIKNKYLTTLSILGIFLIPFMSYAICTYSMELDCNVRVGFVKPNPCTYDGDLVVGAQYVNGQYTYKYKNYGSENSWFELSEDGWGVMLTDKNSTAPVTTTLCTTINDKPIVSMSSMFYDSKASSVDTSSFDTSSVVTMNKMFKYSSFTSIDVLNFDTSNVADMSNMFGSSYYLTSLDLSSFDISKITNLTNFILSCRALEYINFSNWDFSNFESMRYLFSGSTTPSLKTIDFSNTILPSNCGSLFQSIDSVETIIFDNIDTSNVTNMSSMFSSCSSLESIDLSAFNTSNVTQFDSMFSGCSKLASINLSNFDFTKYDKSSIMMNLASNIASSIKSLNFTNVKFPSNMVYDFGGLSNVEEIILDNVDTSNVTNMEALFLGCSHLTSLDLSSFDTSNVTNMNSMFNGASSITSLDLSNFDTSNVTNMGAMFVNASSLSSVDLSSFDTSKVENMNSMFFNMRNLTTLDLSSFDLSSVMNSDGLFGNCSSLTTVYARTQSDLELLANSRNKPENVQVVLKSV